MSIFSLHLPCVSEFNHRTSRDFVPVCVCVMGWVGVCVGGVLPCACTHLPFLETAAAALHVKASLSTPTQDLGQRVRPLKKNNNARDKPCINSFLIPRSARTQAAAHPFLLKGARQLRDPSTFKCIMNGCRSSSCKLWSCHKVIQGQRHLKTAYVL